MTRLGIQQLLRMSKDEQTRVVDLPRVLRGAAVGSALAVGLPLVARAQTDYYNTDRNRPIRIEDAYPTERYSFDAHLAPFRLERSTGGVYSWSVDPEIAYGMLPRTQLEVGLPLAYADLGGSRRRVGVAGLDVSVLYNLNAETSRLPAFGLRATTLAPVGSLAPDNAYASLAGILTRTYTWARIHVNGEYTLGPSSPGVTAPVLEPSTPRVDEGVGEVSRWLAGAAVDRTFPLRSILVTGELYARQPIQPDEDVEWNVGAGMRYQVNPLYALDGGAGKRLSGADRAWYVTFGVARVFAIRSLMPRR